jgi:hypothetical protein
VSDGGRDLRRVAMLRALYRLGLATSNPAFERACADDLRPARGMYAGALVGWLIWAVAGYVALVLT